MQSVTGLENLANLKLQVRVEAYDYLFRDLVQVRVLQNSVDNDVHMELHRVRVSNDVVQLVHVEGADSTGH